MSHGKIRKQTNCLNCNHTVSERFCPHCGQENIEPKQSAHHLIFHFFEDLTHYDGSFWKTIKNLLFKPGQLTLAYLEGKRQMYVAPVKLYIFISFITFLIPNFLNTGDAHTEVNGKEGTIIEDTIKSSSINSNINYGLEFDEEVNQFLVLKSEKKLDSLFKTPENQSFWLQIFKPVIKRYVNLKIEGNTNRQILSKFTDTFVHTLPKALFLYMPIFAFILWLFHDKKKWWFFDHGIFTLHYFSFLLLSTLLLICSDAFFEWLNVPWINIIYFIGACLGLIYTIRYYFLASRMVFEHSKKVNLIKGSVIFLVNGILITVHILILIYISLLMLH